MGNCTLKTEKENTPIAITRNQFQYQYAIGRGGFGKVWRVTHKKTKLNYAIKEMSKARVLAKKSAHSVLNERKILAVPRHKFIVNMTYAFQDTDNLYLALDLLTGGDLRYHINRRKTFTEEQTSNLMIRIFCVLSLSRSRILTLQFHHTQRREA